MICTILDNLIIILLTIIGLIHSKTPAVFIIFASILMIRFTYKSFAEETSAKHVVCFDMAILILFSVVSGGFTGFLIFSLERDVSIRFRMLFGTGSFIVFNIISMPATPIAVRILFGILLFLLLMLICYIYEGIAWAEKRNRDGMDRLVQSNINELHEKRLNEQLLIQKSVDERNARLLERENISRNIHNSVGHSITAAIMTLDAADMLYDIKPKKQEKR